MMSTSEAQKRAHERYNTKNPSIHYRAGDLQEDLKARTRKGGSLAETTRRDLGRYYKLMKEEIALLELERYELVAILNNCRGMFAGESDEVDAAPICGKLVYYAPELGGLKDRLVDRLRDLTYAQTYALADLICMYSVQELPADEFLRGLGL